MNIRYVDNILLRPSHFRAHLVSARLFITTNGTEKAFTTISTCPKVTLRFSMENCHCDL